MEMSVSEEQYQKSLAIVDVLKKLYSDEEDECFSLVTKLSRHPKAVEYLVKVLKEMGKLND